MKKSKKILITNITREVFIVRGGSERLPQFGMHGAAIEQILSELSKEGKNCETFSHSENLSTERDAEKAAEMEFDGEGVR